VDAMQVTRTAGVKELLVVMEIEAVEVGALPADNLLDAQNLAAPDFQRSAGARYDDKLLHQSSWRLGHDVSFSHEGRAGLMSVRRSERRPDAINLINVR
jgi:hypothetical protein